MLLKKLGDDRILLGQLFLCRVELGFQIPFVDAIFGGLKGLLPVLEQLTLPLVEHADLDPHLLADRGDRHAFHKVPPDRPDLLLAVKVPPRLPVLAHRQPSSSVSPYYATDFGDCPFPREAAQTEAAASWASSQLCKKTISSGTTFPSARMPSTMPRISEQRFFL